MRMVNRYTISSLLSLPPSLPPPSSLRPPSVFLLPFVLFTLSFLFSLCMQNTSTGVVTLYMKGADAVMANIVKYNDWLDEEVSEHFTTLTHTHIHTHTHHTHTHTTHTHTHHTHTHTTHTHTPHTHSVVTWLERDSEHWLWVNEY